ncbi:MAG TPA: hypothetical protein VGZ93_04815 [Candidatus Methylacidiphilales bacterium]|jgi:hypothetical protein|nr:hypothetical protein [Candidatus Methylacidiphilales bacterium]
MNPLDDQLDRLFRAAARAIAGRPEPVAAPSYGLDTRVMAAWRAAQSTEPGFWDMALLVRGLIVAGLIMAVSFWPLFKSTETPANPFAEYLQLTDSTIPSDDAP